MAATVVPRTAAGPLGVGPGGVPAAGGPVAGPRVHVAGAPGGRAAVDPGRRMAGALTLSPHEGPDVVGVQTAAGAKVAGMRALVELGAPGRGDLGAPAAGDDAVGQVELPEVPARPHVPVVRGFSVGTHLAVAGGGRADAAAEDVRAVAAFVGPAVLGSAAAHPGEGGRRGVPEGV